MSAHKLGQNQVYQNKIDDDGSSFDESIYEKKANLITL